MKPSWARLKQLLQCHSSSLAWRVVFFFLWCSECGFRSFFTLDMKILGKRQNSKRDYATFAEQCPLCFDLSQFALKRHQLHLASWGQHEKKASQHNKWHSITSSSGYCKHVSELLPTCIRQNAISTLAFGPVALTPWWTALCVLIFTSAPLYSICQVCSQLEMLFIKLTFSSVKKEELKEVVRGEMQHKNKTFPNWWGATTSQPLYRQNKGRAAKSKTEMLMLPIFFLLVR